MFQLSESDTKMTDSARGNTWRHVGDIEQDLDKPDPWYNIELGAFGTSPIGQLKMGLSPVYFDSAQDRDPVVLLAIEAVLAWRPYGLGMRRGDGYNRCTFKGVQYRLSDFGPYFSEEPDAP